MVVIVAGSKLPKIRISKDQFADIVEHVSAISDHIDTVSLSDWLTADEYLRKYFQAELEVEEYGADDIRFRISPPLTHKVNSEMLRDL